MNSVFSIVVLYIIDTIVVWTFDVQMLYMNLKQDSVPFANEIFCLEFDNWVSNMCNRFCSNEQFIRQLMKNKMIFLNKWLSTGCLDTHLAKSLSLLLVHWYLCSAECSSNQVMKGKLSLLVCIWGHEFVLPKKFSGTNDIISMFVHVLSFKCCAMLQTFKCWGSLLWTVADTLFM